MPFHSGIKRGSEKAEGRRRKNKSKSKSKSQKPQGWLSLAESENMIRAALPTKILIIAILTAISNFTCHCEEAEVGRQRVLLVASPMSKTHGLLTACNDK